MWIDLLAIALAAALCAAWVLVQRFVDDHDPCQPGVEGQCGCKGAAAASCQRRDEPARVLPHARRPQLGPEERLRGFDAATERQELRDLQRRAQGAGEEPADRGWTRADLHTRGPA